MHRRRRGRSGPCVRHRRLQRARFPIQNSWARSGQRRFRSAHVSRLAGERHGLLGGAARRADRGSSGYFSGTELALRGANRRGARLCAVLAQREVAPFIVDMENNGELSSSGLFRTQDDDLRALVDNHLPQALKTWSSPAISRSTSPSSPTAESTAKAMLTSTLSSGFPSCTETHFSCLPDVGERHLVLAEGHHRRCVARAAALDRGRLAGPAGATRCAQIFEYAHRAAGSRPGMPIWEETRGNAMAIGQREQSGRAS